ncbi:SUMF1/EgtB/PvdO family nonheme iron enzyme [Paenirhodobacter sp.]|uniref:SUMF1/EgtB/PvdO family nonheme iron enzyme n=1 Tax=Paenirhodobacter sp. TaxID=1965326 RepID=UPI003B3E664E
MPMRIGFSRGTGQTWRLPTDEEWAQAAGALFRDDALGIADDPANPAVRWLAEYDAETARDRSRDRDIRPVGTLNRSPTGVHDIGGAVWEWTSTCLRQVDVDAQGAILKERHSCGIYLAEGLHRAALTAFVREPKAGGCSVGAPPDNMGFRLVREDDATGG